MVETNYYKPRKWDVFFIGAGNDGVEEAIPGERYLAFPSMVVEKVYKHKKWWQFWKKKELLGIKVLWLGD